jgi:uncharacterized protein
MAQQIKTYFVAGRRVIIDAGKRDASYTPMSDETRVIWTLEALRERREEILAVAARHGVFNVRVVGSVARGDATAESDVDLLVSAREGVSVFDLVGLWLDLQDLLNSKVSVITDDDHPRRERFMRRIRKDAVPL